MKTKLLTLLFFVAAVCLVSTAAAQSWLRTETEELKGEYGEIAKTLQTTNDENVLIEILQQPGTENEILFLKMLACKRLATHGTKAAVPVLAAALSDEKMSHYARYALEPIPGTEVDKALWDATKTLKGKLLIGVINSIGIRRHPGANDYLIALIASEDAAGRNDIEVARAVAAAYGMIASGDAVRFYAGGMLDMNLDVTPADFQRAVADAAFNCAEIIRAKGDTADAARIYHNIPAIPMISDFQKESAVYHEILTLGEKGIDLLVKQIQGTDSKMFGVAMKAARELPAGEKVTQALVGELTGLSDKDRKAQLILAIGDRTDAESKKVSLPKIAELAKSGDAEIRLAAIKSLKNIGDSSVLGMLIDATTDSNEEVAAAAKATLAEIPGKEVDDAIVAMLAKDDAPSKIAAIKLVEERRIVRAFPELKKAAESANQDVRRAALSAISEVVTLADLAILVDILAEAKTPEEIDANQWALKAACSRMPKEEVAAKVVEFINKADEKAKMNLLEILMQIGGETAVRTVSDYAWGTSDALKDKATELLGKWRDPDDANRVAAVCLKLAKEAPDKYKLRGLRGYVRYPRQFAMDEPQRIEMVNQYLKIAARPEDKALVFQAFTKYPSAKMLEEVMKLVDDPQVGEDACQAAVTVANRIQGASQATADAMKKVMSVSKNADILARAKAVLDKQ